ncbi:MAG: hypothetical protein WCS85_04820 [Candidatus Peribacteraceae bacterium]|jgi:hypothetical protein
MVSFSSENDAKAAEARRLAPLREEQIQGMSIRRENVRHDLAQALNELTDEALRDAYPGYCAFVRDWNTSKRKSMRTLTFEAFCEWMRSDPNEARERIRDYRDGFARTMERAKQDGEAAEGLWS